MSSPYRPQPQQNELTNTQASDRTDQTAEMSLADQRDAMIGRPSKQSKSNDREHLRDR